MRAPHAQPFCLFQSEAGVVVPAEAGQKPIQTDQHMIEIARAKFPGQGPAKAGLANAGRAGEHNDMSATASLACRLLPGQGGRGGAGRFRCTPLPAVEKAERGEVGVQIACLHIVAGAGKHALLQGFSLAIHKTVERGKRLGKLHTRPVELMAAYNAAPGREGVQAKGQRRKEGSLSVAQGMQACAHAGNAVDNTAQGKALALGCFQGARKIHVAAAFGIHGKSVHGSTMYLGTHAFVVRKLPDKDLRVASAQVEAFCRRQDLVAHG